MCFKNDQLQLIETFLMLGRTQLKGEDVRTAAPLRGNLSAAQGPDQATGLVGWMASWGVSLLLP